MKERKRLGLALCGSYCTYEKVLKEAEKLADDWDITAVMSETAACTDSRFGKAEEVLNLEKIRDKFAGHGGGDDRMMDAFVEMLTNEGTAPKTSIDVSVDSHIMAMAAEHSRLCGGQNILLRDFAAQNTAGGCV